MQIGDRLRELARNLYWTWHPEIIEVFRDLDPALWREVNHNPVDFFDRLDAGVLEAKTSELALDARISLAFHRMHEYLSMRDTWGARHAGVLGARPVLYFSAEFGLHESLPIYSGGLGVLAGDHLKAASDLGVPLVGVGLFYAKGYFRQSLDKDGWQHEDYFVSDVNKLPMNRAVDADGKPLRVRVRTRESTICAEVWTAQVGRNRLLLLDTNVQENTPDDQALTSILYGGDSRVRIRQELVLGVGGLLAAEAMGICPGVIHLNEGHSVFATLAAARSMMRREGRGFNDVREKVATMTVFTTHTPVPAGHDRFDADLIERNLGPLREELDLSPRDFMSLGRVEPDDERELFCMTVLGLKMAQYRNAVSARHARLSRAMWRRVWPKLPEDMVPIGHITNGVHSTSWLAVPMAPLFERHLGIDWEDRMHDALTWQGIDKIDDEEFWEQHQILKVRLIEYVTRCVARQEAQRGRPGGQAPAPVRLDPMALTIGFARRFAEYKRADLLASDVERLERLVNNPGKPVQIIFAGKAHPNSEGGKLLIQQIFRITRRPSLAGRVVFLEDHDMNVGRHLVQGADVWLNNPRRPMEACGTSGQKVVFNGGLNLSIPDGWWAEAYDGANGFVIGCGLEHADAAHQDNIDRSALYDVLENEVVPMFYDRNNKGIPHRWIARQKNAMQSLPWRFSAQRMVRDYTMRCYLPAAGGVTCSLP